MKERPILFSGEMVRAILEGRKTQTRRVCNPQPDGTPFSVQTVTKTSGQAVVPKVAGRLSPYGEAGDVLWVREAWCHAEPHGFPLVPA